jgi:hypothetical protein
MDLDVAKLEKYVHSMGVEHKLTAEWTWGKNKSEFKI